VSTSPARGEPVEPDPEELARRATPATRRRAPRYRAFLQTGVLVGLVAAVLVVILVPRAEGDAAALSGVGTGPVLLFVALGGCLLGALVGGLVAVLLDRRAGR
jgi:hypothetical protein